MSCTNPHKKTIVCILAKCPPATPVLTLTVDDLLTLIFSDERAAAVAERWGGAYVAMLANRLAEKEQG